MDNKFVASTPDWLKPIIEQASQKWGMPVHILSSQIMHESGFNTQARNANKNLWGGVDSTDRGIAQINDKWHPDVSSAQADDPNFAVDWMARNMASKFKQYGSWDQALSAYNTGSPTQGLGGYAKAVLQTAQQALGSIAQGLQGNQTTQTPSFDKVGQTPVGRTLYSGLLSQFDTGGAPQAYQPTPYQAPQVPHTTSQGLVSPIQTTNLVSPLPGDQKSNYDVPSFIKAIGSLVGGQHAN